MKTKLALAILLLALLFNFQKGSAQAPAWAWAKSASGPLSDFGSSIASDASGNVLVAGYFQSDSITFGTTTLYNTASNSTQDMFITKYDAAGNVLWAKSAGNFYNEQARGIAIDANGNILVTGDFDGPSVTFGATTLTSAGGSDVFIVKYDATGNVTWAESLGGTSDDFATSISTDASGNMMVTGTFLSDTITLGATTLTNAGHYDLFIAKYDASGNAQWAQSAGGSSYEAVYGSADASGNVVVTGSFNSDSIAFGTTTLINASAGTTDMFIVKYDAAGNVLWAKSAGGSNYDNGNGSCTDASGNVLVTGYFESPSITFGTVTLTNAGTGDVFVVKYDASGNILWAKSEGGTSPDYPAGISTDAGGNIFAAGNFNSPAITIGTTTLTNAGISDIFIVKYDALGNVVWATSATGTSADWNYGICTDPNGNTLLTGTFASPITFGTITLTNGLSQDIFIAKLDNTTGIAEQIQNNTLILYPNPATDYITIITGNNKKQVITITDITGKIIYSTTTLSDKTIINTKDFSQGIYVVQVQAGDAVETRKMVITR